MAEQGVPLLALVCWLVSSASAGLDRCRAFHLSFQGHGALGARFTRLGTNVLIQKGKTRYFPDCNPLDLQALLQWVSSKCNNNICSEEFLMHDEFARHFTLRPRYDKCAFSHFHVDLFSLTKDNFIKSLNQIHVHTLHMQHFCGWQSWLLMQTNLELKSNQRRACRDRYTSVAIFSN